MNSSFRSSQDDFAHTMGKGAGSAHAGVVMRVPVRCCCDPKRLLGYLPLRECEPGRRYRFPVLIGSHASIAPSASRVEHVELEAACAIGYFDLGGSAQEVALSSNETPLERLRLIPGFEEVNRRVPIGRCGSAKSKRTTKPLSFGVVQPLRRKR